MIESHPDKSELTDRQSASIPDLPRPVWIILLAIMVLIVSTIASRTPASGQGIGPSGQGIGLDAIIMDGDASGMNLLNSVLIDGGSRVDNTWQCSRPISYDGITTVFDFGNVGFLRSASYGQSVQLVAALANFDSDADADGWRAELVVLSADDYPVTVPAYAYFELTPKHWNPFDIYLPQRPSNLNWVKPISWNMPLYFDEDGVARVKLPLRRSIEVDWDKRFSYPDTGLLTVRVSIRGGETLHSSAVVQIRAPVLVDTWRPDR
ncbi:hypothetical protein CA13_22580 [Planctomycetes bacterium CA13]|uniref:Uncharacterized protein n=1 Tax=Novipirellula herctigrandis TaxID=2527986 RepID=A0A5C5Z0B5_9BACT|nr:hypothetical protein CA13_22580 [Planctomycetes bacterium CA13]